ncbi:hypothetical protein G9A89_007256 [Geosiphon pyriformis]|nr:hypothetical protein G9A89_007256 [Geosiphon pyriformis]
MSQKRCSLKTTALQSKPYPSKAQKIPPEVFLSICEHLKPQYLFSLSKVCRLYREFLSSTISSVTQKIWRSSRQRFLPHCILPPPQGMCEQRYIWLSMFTNKCEFCHSKDVIVSSQVYWVFRVRCCINCLIARTVSKHKILKEGKISKAVLACLPYIHPCGYRLYWLSDIYKAQNEYSLLSPSETGSWLIEKHETAQQITRDAKIREKAFNHLSYQNGLDVGLRISFENWTRRAWMMLKELGEELKCETKSVTRSVTYQEWEQYFDPDWEEEVWDEWRMAMKRECLRVSKRTTGFSVSVWSGFCRKLTGH